MSDILTQSLPKSANEYRAAIQEMFVEMERRDERIAKDQQEIERLKAQTNAILAELKKR